MSRIPADRSSVREILDQAMATLSPVAEPESPQDFLQTVTTAQDIDAQARQLLQHSVLAAREAGATWKDIGQTLGISKQAAQKRFASPHQLPNLALAADERLLGPVTMFDEVAELNLAGRYGWHSVDFGIAHHRVVHSKTQWEHCRVSGQKKIADLEGDGWVRIGTSFPYTFLKRDTTKPALSEST